MCEFIKVKRDDDGSYNLIDAESGSLLFTYWFRSIMEPYEDEASDSVFASCYVIRSENGKFGRLAELKKDGDVVLHGAYDIIKCVKDGLYIASNGNGFNVFSIDGFLPVCGTWFTDMIECNGYFVGLYPDGARRIIKRDGSFIGGTFTEVECDDFDGNVVRVQTPSGKWNYLVLPSGKLLCDNDFDKCPSRFSYGDGYAKVKTEQGVNMVDNKGRLILPNGCFDCKCAENGNISVMMKMTTDGITHVNIYSPSLGRYLLDEWYREHFSLSDGKVIVYDDYGNYNVVSPEGRLLFDEWLDDMDLWDEDGLAIVMVGGVYNVADTDGKILMPQWSRQILRPKRGVRVAFVDGRVPTFFDGSGHVHTGFSAVLTNSTHYYAQDETGMTYRLRANGDGLHFTKVKNTDRLGLRKIMA